MVSMLNQAKLQIWMSILLHGQNESIMSWNQHHLLMLKVYLAWQKMTVMGVQKKSKRDGVILILHTLAVHHSLKIIQDMEMGVALINWFKMQYLATTLTKRFLEVIHWNWNRRLEPAEVKHCLRKRLIFISLWLMHFMVLRERKVISCPVC